MQSKIADDPAAMKNIGFAIKLIAASAAVVTYVGVTHIGVKAVTKALNIEFED